MKDYLNSIVCGDCLEVMKKFPDQNIDLIFTSPPYNMGKKGPIDHKKLSKVPGRFYDEYSDSKDENEYIAWSIKVIKECLRVSRYVFWNIQFIRSTRNCIVALQTELKNNLKDITIWSKPARISITGKNGGMAKGWEYVFMFGQNNLTTFEYNNYPPNKWVPNIIHINKDGGDFFQEHHATFPKKLADWFIKNWTKEGDVVLDPFAGTGTTCVSALGLKRNYIGIELSNQYCEISKERIKKAKVDLDNSFEIVL